MKNSFISLILLAGFLVSACGNQNEASTTTIPILENSTSTPDPCSSENLNNSIKPINDHQREFDDASLLASNVPQEQLPPLIAEMQRIRREAEDQIVASCLSTLKTHQLNHMKIVIDTMLAFVGGADSTTLNNGIAQAGSEHDLYTLEMARLLGITLVPATNAPAPSGTQSP